MPSPTTTGRSRGSCLSLWDWVFGTLYMPDKREQIEFGLGRESAEFATVKDLLLRPFSKAARLFVRRTAPAPAVVEHET